MLYKGFDFVVAKEGGENTGNIDVTFENLVKAQERKAHFAVVVSAMRKEGEFNTTKMLESIGTKIATGDKEGALWELAQLEEFHKSLLDRNFSGNSDTRNQMFAFITEEFQRVRDRISTSQSQFLPSMKNDFSLQTIATDDFFSLKGWGEVFCAQFYQRLLQLSGKEISFIDTSSQKNNIIPWNDSFEATLNYFRKSVAPRILRLSSGLTLIPWYIGGINWGIDASIGSGYSDATAALTAVSVQEILGREKKVLLEILKSVDGIMSADPRLLDDPASAQLIERLPFMIAKEIVGVRGAQAKLLNAEAMKPQVIRSGVSVRLRNPTKPESPGTIIDAVWDKNSFGVEAVLARDNVAFVSLSSIDMPQGYLARVLDIVKEYKSVDIVSCSETEFSFTVDTKKEWDRAAVEEMRQEIVREIFAGKEDDFNFTNVLYDQSLVFCIGQNMKDRVGLLAAATTALKDAGINVELVSQGQLQRAMTFGVASEDMRKAVNVLHEKLVGEK